MRSSSFIRANKQVFSVEIYANKQVFPSSNQNFVQSIFTATNDEGIDWSHLIREIYGKKTWEKNDNHYLTLST